MTSHVYIYALKDPTTGRCRYVGKTVRTKTRLNEHVYQASRGRTHRDCWIRGLKAQGLRPVFEVLDEVPGTEWEFWEREYIRVFRLIGVNLTNLSDGGESPTGLTEESRDKMREAARTRTFTSETRAKMSANLRGKPSRNSGHKHSEESKLKIGAAQLGTKRTFETRQKMRQAALGKVFSSAHCENIRLAKLGKKKV